MKTKIWRKTRKNKKGNSRLRMMRSMLNQIEHWNDTRENLSMEELKLRLEWKMGKLMRAFDSDSIASLTLGDLAELLWAMDARLEFKITDNNNEKSKAQIKREKREGEEREMAKKKKNEKKCIRRRAGEREVEVVTRRSTRRVPRVQMTKDKEG